MNIPPLAELFIPILKQNKLISEREEDNNYRLIMLSLFKDLLEAEKYINKCHINSKLLIDFLLFISQAILACFYLNLYNVRINFNICYCILNLFKFNIIKILL